MGAAVFFLRSPAHCPAPTHPALLCLRLAQGSQLVSSLGDLPNGFRVGSPSKLSELGLMRRALLARKKGEKKGWREAPQAKAPHTEDKGASQSDGHPQKHTHDKRAGLAPAATGPLETLLHALLECPAVQPALQWLAALWRRRRSVTGIEPALAQSATGPNQAHGV